MFAPPPAPSLCVALQLLCPLVKAGNGNATGVRSHAQEEREGRRPRSQLTGIIYIEPEREWALFSEVLETRSQLPDHVEHPCRAQLPRTPPLPLLAPLSRTAHLFLVAFREINSINWLSLLSIECIHKPFFREFHLFIHSHAQRHTDTHTQTHNYTHIQTHTPANGNNFALASALFRGKCCN